MDKSRSIAGKVVGTNLRAVRAEMELTQEQVAEAARTTAQYVQEVERGAKLPSITMLMRFAGAVGVAPARFLEGLTVPKAPPAPRRSRKKK